MDAVVKTLSDRLKTPAEARQPAPRPTQEEAEAAVRVLLAYAGDDPDREGLVDTPRRVAKAYRELFGGYFEDAGEILDRVFEEVDGYDDMVLVRDIPFSSHCEHHMVPFVGRAHIAYYPSEGVVGLSKLARLVDMYARRLQTQEAMTAQVVEAIETHLKPRGVAVFIEAEHMCMSMRGVRKQGAKTITTRFTGVFRDDPAEQVRFMSMARGKIFRGHGSARMDRQAILDRLRENQRQLRDRGVLHAALFGSRARQDARPDSDTDILVELDPDRRLSVYEYVGLKEFVATLIGGPVDVVAREYLKTPLRAPTAADAIYAF